MLDSGLLAAGFAGFWLGCFTIVLIVVVCFCHVVFWYMEYLWGDLTLHYDTWLMFVFVFLRWPLFQPSIHWIHCFAMFCSFRATAPATHQGDLAQFSESLLNNGTPTRQQVQSLGWWIITASEEPKRRCLGAIFSFEFHVRLEMVSTCFDTMYLCFMYLYDSIVGCNLMKYWSRWVSHQDRCLLQNWQLAPEVWRWTDECFLLMAERPGFHAFTEVRGWECGGRVSMIFIPSSRWRGTYLLLHLRQRADMLHKL